MPTAQQSRVKLGFDSQFRFFENYFVIAGSLKDLESELKSVMQTFSYAADNFRKVLGINEIAKNFFYHPYLLNSLFYFLHITNANIIFKGELLKAVCALQESGSLS